MKDERNSENGNEKEVRSSARLGLGFKARVASGWLWPRINRGSVSVWNFDEYSYSSTAQDDVIIVYVDRALGFGSTSTLLMWAMK